MTPLTEWLKPPRSLLTLLLLGTLVAVSALSWFSWKLLDQERIVEAQRARERLEQSAGRVAAHASEVLAETGERLSAWAASPPSEVKAESGLLLILTSRTLSAVSPGRLLYSPVVTEQGDAPDEAFRDGEIIEFQQGRADAALDFYTHLADAKSPDVRAGALLRMARVLRRSGHSDQARTAYLRLASIREARVAGAPAELVGSEAACELSGAAPACAQELTDQLARGAFALTRAQFDFYWEELARLASHPAPALPADALAASELAARAWQALSSDSAARGQATIWSGDRPCLLIWRGIPGRRAVLALEPERLLERIVTDGLSYAAIDAEGRTVAGHKRGQQRTIVQTPAETQLPWTLYIAEQPGFAEAGSTARRQFVELVTAITILFLLGGSWAIARAVRRDLEIRRMQSDFVSAVSHEFRSPLTTMRQLSEMLALGRVSEPRRQVYYETLVNETTRLQRLVEGLLNFGRVEAGIRRDRFEQVDAGELIAKVADEFAPQLNGSGRRIELSGNTASCAIEADPEALTVAIRNLVDNALKYAPACPVIRVEWGSEDRQVAIRVRDTGPGIPVSEQRAIFQKFVRGSAASAAKVRGSGIGLAMVRNIVAAHGGAVTLASEQGAGSTFTMLLPTGAKSR